MKQRITRLLPLLLFLIILLGGLYLRFWNIQYSFGFGWDQSRDAWKVRDLLDGNNPLEGPKTGIGQFHLGPLHYYFMAPFFAFTQLDPMAANYYNITVNIITFIVIFLVLRSLFSTPAALFGLFLYAVNAYCIKQNIIPWNVSLLIMTAFTVFWLQVQIIIKERYKLIPLLAIAVGFAFHVHFTAIFLIPIIALSSLLIKQKLVVLKLAAFSLPLFLLFLVSNVFFNIQTSGGETGKFTKFLNEYYHGFSLRFMLHKLSDALLMFKVIIQYPAIEFLKYLIPLIFYLYIFLKDQQTAAKKIATLTAIWLFIPWWVFTLYSGPTSDYYYLFTLPVVFYILIYLQNKLINLRPYLVIPILVIIWSLYAWYNTQGLLVKPSWGGLEKTKAEVRQGLKDGKEYPYNEGDLNSYLTTIWTDQEIRNTPDRPTVSIVNVVRNNINLEAEHNLVTTAGHYATWLWNWEALKNKTLTHYGTDAMRDENHGLIIEIDRVITDQAGIPFKGDLLAQYTLQEKRALINHIFENFKTAFGYHAEVIGARQLEASDLIEIRKVYAIKALAIIDKNQSFQPPTTAYFANRINLSQPATSYNQSTKVLVSWMLPYTTQDLSQQLSQNLQGNTGFYIISNENPDFSQAITLISNYQVQTLHQVGYKRLLKRQL